MLLLVCVAVTLTGCALSARAQPAARVAVPAPVPLSPFDDSAVSFFVRDAAAARGELVIVRVCVGANHSIVSADVVESSGDPRFDQLAVGWARQIRLRTVSANGAPVASCGAVRVQMRRVPDTPVFGARGNLLG